MSNDLPNTKRVLSNGTILYPLAVWLTESAIRAIDSRIRGKNYRECRSRSAVASKHAEQLVKGK